MRTLALEVPDDFADDWLERRATPEERARVLRFACALPKRVENEDDLQRLLVERASEPLLKQNRELREALQASVAEAATARAHADLLEREEAGKRELESLKAAELAQARVEGSLAQLRDDHQKLLREKGEGEQAASAQIREQLQEVIRLSNACAALRAEVEELKTPAGRGRVGEFAIADALEEMGFEVQDTSNGAKKDEGYHDLIVRPAGHPDVRIAVECKNKVKIDPGTDLKSFYAKTRDGIARGLFDTAIFVSLRCHTKKAEPHVLEMLEDADGHATVPLSFVGPDRRGDGAHLSREALQAHVCLHSAMHLQLAHVQRLLQTANADEDTQGKVRDVAELCGRELGGLVEDLNQQSRLVAGMVASIRSARLRAIRMISRMGDATRAIPWIHVADPPWMAEFRLARDKVAAGTTDALVWKNMSDAQKKRANDSVGRETLFRAAHEEAKRLCSAQGADAEEEAGE